MTTSSQEENRAELSRLLVQAIGLIGDVSIKPGEMPLEQLSPFISLIISIGNCAIKLGWNPPFHLEKREGKIGNDDHRYRVLLLQLPWDGREEMLFDAYVSNPTDRLESGMLPVKQIFHGFDEQGKQSVIAHLKIWQRFIESQPDHTAQHAEGINKSENHRNPLKGGRGGNANPNLEKGKKNRLRKPSDVALAAYRVHIATGRPQTEIAQALAQQFREPIKQNIVSRYIKQVERYLSAGNVLPDLPKPAKPAKSIDPAKLDLGNRTDSLTQRQRHRKSNEE